MSAGPRELKFDEFFRSDHYLAMGGAETVYLQVLDLRDLDHLHLIAAGVVPAIT